jgi:ABC-type transport system substrate-binding protein
MRRPLRKLRYHQHCCKPRRAIMPVRLPSSAVRLIPLVITAGLALAGFGISAAAAPLPNKTIVFCSEDSDKSVAKVEKLDPYTVRFTLNTVNAPFLSELAMPFASVISAEYADQLMKAGKASDLNLYPVDTGPFIFRRPTQFWNRTQMT